MVQLKGIYENGLITLTESVLSDKPLEVIVTFVDEDLSIASKRLSLSDFSFQRARALSKNLKGDLSDTVIESRREAL